VAGLFRPDLLADPGCAFLGCYRDGVLAVAALRPGLPVVGYERGEDMAAAREAGGRVIGPLRVWTRGSAVP
jgi:hypothetical protein